MHGSKKSGLVTRLGSLRARSTGLGATATTEVTFIALQEELDGRTIDWMEHVTDDQYKA